MGIGQQQGNSRWWRNGPRAMQQAITHGALEEVLELMSRDVALEVWKTRTPDP